MAECTIARCSQERRFFRKELQRWSRDVLYVVGLERVAEELMGVGRWKTLTQPFRDLEKTEPEDWNPEDICYFCNSKKQPPYDPASGMVHGADGYNSFKIEGDDLSTSSDQALVPGPLLPWYPGSSSPSSCDQPLDLSMHSSRRNTDNTDHHKASHSLLYIPPALHNKKGNVQDSTKKSVLKVPQVPVKQGQRKRLDPTSKRSYTEEELQAALRDIQSGKLGTRRAAVIYGIPRSTLRNKVYKLDMGRNKGVRNSTTSKTCNGNKKTDKETAKNKNAECTESEKLTSSKQCSAAASASESLRQLLKNTITQKTKNVSSRSNDKHKSDTNQFQSSLFYNPEVTAEMLSTLEYGQALAPFLSQIISNIQHVALAKYKESYNNPTISALKDDLKLPLLHDLIRCLMEERLESEREQHHSNQSSPQECSTAGSSLEDGGADSSANVILKIPSYKPAKSPPASSDAVVSSSPVLPSLSCTSGTSSSSSHGHVRNKGIAVSLKELIARSISKRVINSHPSEDGPPSKRPHVMTDTKCSSNNSALSTSPESHKQSSLHYSSSSADNSKSEKRTRPKRGRYRNYDRDNLARAVRAVQRGEMSVHRAGTYFGVPHSTLEYKVKERHLLRPRKRDNIASSSSVGSLLTVSGQSSSTSTVKTTDSSSVSAVNCKAEKNSATTESTDLQNGLKSLVNSDHFTMGLSLPSHLSLWQNMPFFSMDFSQLNSNNFFASQMMRKLQENARLHEEAQRKQKNQEIGLLETLIKSSLERSISPNDKSSAPVLVSAESSTVTVKTEDSTESSTVTVKTEADDK